MRRWLWIAVGVACGVLLVLIAAMFVLYGASQQVPEFYRQALETDPARRREASDAMLQRATALANDVKKEGRWQGLFTAEQINGWLAVDLVENHPDLLPGDISDPRVAIEPEGLTVAFRFQRGKINTVLSLSADAYLTEPNVAALRIRKARAGMLPLPLEKVLEYISKAAKRLELKLEWRQADGDPVALISIPPPRDEEDRLVQIETLRLGKGEVYVSGSTEGR